MIKYNDYELLYLMNEFDEEAEQIFYDKYSNLIKMRVHKFKIKNRYKDDFFQEGLYMLFIATKTYNDNFGKTFNKYFDLILQRRFIRLISKEKRYFYDVDFKEADLILKDSSSFEYGISAVKGLSSFEEKVLFLKKKNYRPKEIAGILNLDVKSVYNCMCRIKSKYNKK